MLDSDGGARGRALEELGKAGRRGVVPTRDMASDIMYPASLEGAIFALAQKNSYGMETSLQRRGEAVVDVQWERGERWRQWQFVEGLLNFASMRASMRVLSA